MVKFDPRSPIGSRGFLASARLSREDECRPLGPLLALLQLSDSLFPSGAFTHSYGLEQLVRERLISSPAAVEDFVVSVLQGSLATAEAPAAFCAASAARVDDLDAVLSLDRALYRLKTAAELRDASLQAGRRLLEETAIHVPAGLLSHYVEQVRQDRTLGTYPVAFGVASGVQGAAPVDVAAAVMQGAVSSLLQASMRLLPLSHRDTQAILHRLRPRIAFLAGEIEAAGLNPQSYKLKPLMSFHPLQEIASMRHALSQARLFSS